MQSFTIPELKRPKPVPKDQEWFWSAEWQKGEREVDEDLKAGRYKTFDSVEKLLAYLNLPIICPINSDTKHLIFPAWHPKSDPSVSFGNLATATELLDSTPI
jgi:hypothetical protein